MKWFTSDTHFNHNNIIKYCSRPFANVDEMREKLVENWNARVYKSDTVYHVGDFGLGMEQEEVEKLLARLNGWKILIAGNHDSGKVRRAAGWLQVVKHMTIAGDTGYAFDMIHKPGDAEKLLPYTARKLVLHGHQHGTPDLHPYKGVVGWTYYDVGVDPNEYMPISEPEVLAKIFTDAD